MAQGVRRHLLGDAGLPGALVQDLLHATGGQPSAQAIEEQRFGGLIVQQPGPAFLQIGLQRPARRLAQQDDALFSTLAQDPCLLLAQVDAPQVQPYQLARPHAAGVEQLQDSAVAQALGCGGIRRGEQDHGLWHGEEVRQAFLLARAGHAPQRVVGDEALTLQVLVERADLGHAPGDARFDITLRLQPGQIAPHGQAIHRAPRLQALPAQELPKLLDLPPVQGDSQRRGILLRRHVGDELGEVFFHLRSHLPVRTCARGFSTRRR